MRIRAPLLLSIAVVLLQACSAGRTMEDLQATIVTPGNFTKGSGEIYNVAVVNRPGDQPSLYRLYLRMDGGGTQTVDVDKAIFMTGQFVELTNDGRAVLLSGTSGNEIREQQKERK